MHITPVIFNFQIKEHLFPEKDSVRREKKMKPITQAKLTIWLAALGHIICTPKMELRQT